MSIRAVKLVESCIGVGLQDALPPFQVPPGVFDVAVGGVVAQRRWRGGAGKGAVVAHMDPQSSSRGAAYRQHRDRGAVVVQPLARQHMGAKQRH